jgi:hypothetical protein
MFACSGSDTSDGDGLPKWVNRGSGAFSESGRKVFYGVGMVSNVRNRALARSISESRARADIQKIFSTYSATMVRDYMASTSAMADASSEEQHVEQALKSYSAGTLSGAMIVDHFWDEDGTCYALAKLDLEEFGKALDDMKELDAKSRDFIRRNADKAFERLEAEEAKRN